PIPLYSHHFSLVLRHLPPSTLFPYTTLFRSHQVAAGAVYVAPHVHRIGQLARLGYTDDALTQAKLLGAVQLLVLSDLSMGTGGDQGRGCCDGNGQNG